MSQAGGKSFLEAWIRRTRRELAVSGRLAQLAVLLSREEGGTIGFWETVLRSLREGTFTPDLDELSAIDRHLARPTASATATQEQALLW